MASASHEPSDHAGPPARTAVAACLAALPHFRMQPAAVIERIAAGCHLRTFRAGEAIFFERQPCHAFFAIHEGGVRLFRLTADGRTQVIHNLGPGRSFAEAALLNIGVFPVSAVATGDPTVLVEVGGDHFRRLLAEDTGLATSIIGSLSMRLLELVERVEDLSVADAGARLARYLLRLPASRARDATVITLPLAKKDLAAQLNLTPETLSRLLRRWHDTGWIESKRQTLAIRDASALLRVAEGRDGT